MSARRLAIVVQRYGPDVHGGAESAARWLAENLAAQPDTEVHVLTSCANDFTTWQNVYPPGRSEINGVYVRRFTVDAPRNWERSREETGRFLLSAHTVEEEINWVRRQGPFCSGLVRHLAAHAARYDAVIFFTYLYATTYFGLPLVAEKAILVPAAHDEPYLYMDAYRALLHLPKYIVYLTTAEKELVQRVSGNTQVPSSVTAIGLKAPADVNPERFRARHGLSGDFLLYGGRLSEAKNVPQLLDYFGRYVAREDRRRDSEPSQLKLALMGRAHMPLFEHEQIVPLGFLSDDEKYDALAAATVLVLPSVYESLSIMILEAWLVETPVLVNGRSAVLRRQVQESSGGLYYTGYDEFEAALDLLLRRPDLRAVMGGHGRRFVASRYDKTQIMAEYQAILQKPPFGAR